MNSSTQSHSLAAIDGLLCAHLMWTAGRRDQLHQQAAGSAGLLARAAHVAGVRIDGLLRWVAEVGADRLTLKVGANPPAKMSAAWKAKWIVASVQLQELHAALTEMISSDPGERLALTKNEAALVSLLTSQGQTGEGLAQALARKGFTGIGPNEISKMARLPHMRALGIRHRRGAGYFVNAMPGPSRGHSVGGKSAGE